MYNTKKISQAKTYLKTNPSKALSLAQKIYQSADNKDKVLLEVSLIILKAQYLLGHSEAGLANAKIFLHQQLKSQNKFGIAKCWYYVAVFHVELINNQKAIDTAVKALKLFRELNNEKEIANLLNVMGCIYLEVNKFEKAYLAFVEGIELSEKTNSEIVQAKTLINFSRLYYNLNEIEEALNVIESAIKLIPKLENVIYEIIIYTNKGTYLYEGGNTKEAKIYFFKALEKIDGNNFTGHEISITSKIAEIYFKENNIEKAIEYANRSYKLTESFEHFNIHFLASYAIHFKALNHTKQYETIIQLYPKIEKYLNDTRIYYTAEVLEELMIAFENNSQPIEAYKIAKKIIELKKVLEQEEKDYKIFTTKAFNQVSQKELKISHQTELLALKEKANHLLKKEIRSKKKIEKKLVLLNKELLSFASIASHDMREPLRIIASYAQLLKRRTPKENHENIEFVDFILNASKRMQNLLSDLIDYTRVGVAEMTFSQINLNIIFEIIQARLRFDIAKYNININIEKLPHAKGTQEIFLLVFESIMNNAIKFRNKEKTTFIKIYSKQKDNKIIINIKDNGIGIEPQFHKIIFDPFKTLHSKAEYQGAGIGLAIAKRIVKDRLNGRIRLKSAIGKGSNFIIELPI